KMTDSLLGPEEAVAVEGSASGLDPEAGTTLSGHSILVGYGRVGSVIAERIVSEGTGLVVIEDAEDRATEARDAGSEVIIANGATERARALANVGGAACLFVAIPNAFEAGQTIEQARATSPGLLIIARAHSDEEAAYLKRLGADRVVMGEREIGLGMLD